VYRTLKKRASVKSRRKEKESKKWKLRGKKDKFDFFFILIQLDEQVRTAKWRLKEIFFKKLLFSVTTMHTMCNIMKLLCCGCFLMSEY
jgi:hypothetical protein